VQNSEGQTLQSRNSLIGQFTEKCCKKNFEPIAKKIGLFAVNSVVCEQIGLIKQQVQVLQLHGAAGKAQQILF